MTARMARKYLSWRRLPWCWAFFRWRFTALRSEGDMVKRIQHIGPFLRNEMGVSLRGMSPMCDHSSIHLSENLFLKVYSIFPRKRACTALHFGNKGWTHPYPAIPHREPDLDAFLSIKPRIPLSQELEQVLVLVGQIEHQESLSRDVEHMNPHEVMEHPACGRVLDALAFLVRQGRSVVLEGIADAVLEGRIDE